MNTYVLGAVHTRRFRDCNKGSEGKVIAGVRYRYDSLPEGSVSLGRITEQVVERYDVASGDKLDEWVTATTTYNALGNIVKVVRTNRTPLINSSSLGNPLPMANVKRTQTFDDYDAFGLVSRRVVSSATTASGTTPATLTRSIAVDPVSMAVVRSTDANGTITRSYSDGFGRPTASTVQPAGQAGEYVLRSVEYAGFTSDEPGARHVTSRSYFGKLTWTDLNAGGSAKNTTTTAYLDEYGRVQYRETDLGSDYNGDRLRAGEVTYDSLGRVVFAADTYPVSEGEAERYGTTTIYRDDGSVHCTVRGRGPQFAATSDNSTARFASCVDRSYSNRRLVLTAKGGNELQPGSGQEGAYDQQVQTAIGWQLEKTRWHDGVVVERSQQAFDRLGHVTRYTRYESPSDSSGAVVWNKYYDSLGQMTRLEEESAAPRVNLYDHWGQVYETRSGAHADTVRRVISQHDGYGRLRQSIAATGTTPEKATHATMHYDVASTSEDHVGATHLLGRLSYTTSYGRRTYYGYDGLGRRATVTRAENNERYTQTFDYALAGHLRGLTFLLPDNDHQPEVVHYSFDSAMRTVGVSYETAAGVEDMFTAEKVDSLGRYRRIVYGNGVQDERSYNSQDRRELVYTALGTASDIVFTKFEKYDAALRVLQRYDYSTVAGIKSKTSRYRYDSLYRLVDAQTENMGTLTLRKSYAYDGLGNLRQVLDVKANTTLTVDNDEDDRDRICSVSQTSGLDEPFVTSSLDSGGFTLRYRSSFFDRGPSCSYTYDAQGNVGVAKGVGDERSFGYYANGAVKTIKSNAGVASYRYDASGAVAGLRVDAANAADNRDDLKLGPLVERIAVTAGSGSTYVVRRTIPGPEGVLAVRGNPHEDTATVYWHGDSKANRVFTDGVTGEVLQMVDFDPFGAIIDDSGAAGTEAYTNYLWNGGDSVKAFKLHHLGARVYDPVVGRFLQRDPLLIGRTASKMHPYAFAHSDPINKSDPSGMDPCDNLSPNCGGASDWYWMMPYSAPYWIERQAGRATGADRPQQPNPGVMIGGRRWRSHQEFLFHLQTLRTLYWRQQQLLQSLLSPIGLELGTRVEGLFQTFAGSALVGAGTVLCLGSDGAGCAAAVPIVALGSDLAAGGVGKTVVGGRTTTVGGQIFGEDGQRWEEMIGLAAAGAWELKALLKGGALLRGSSAGAGAGGAEGGTSLVRGADEVLAQAVSRPPEVVSGFRIYGNKGLVGNSFQRNILLIEAETKSVGNLLRLVRSLEAEAVVAGASELRIVGHAVINRGFLSSRLAQRFGFTFRQINDETIELVKALK